MEIELVVLEVDKSAIISKLLELGAKKVFEADMKQVQYVSGDLKIRVREEGDKILFNLKKPVKDAEFKMSEEYEVEVQDYEKMNTILSHLPLKFKRTLNKHRESYKLGTVKFEFDTYQDEHSFVPTFVELEGENKDDLYEAAEKVGFEKESLTSLSTSQIIKHYSKK